MSKITLSARRPRARMRGFELIFGVEGMKMEVYGPPEYVKVRDREDVGRVVQGARNVGTVQTYAVLFESTGEVKTYAVAAVTRCDAQGNEV